MSNQTRILIADDHKMVRQGLSQICDAEADMKVVGQASDGQEAYEMAVSLQPDIVVMDINMPALNGIQSTRKILSKNPNIGIIALTMYQQDENVLEAIKAGARAFLLKDAGSDELLDAIRAVAAGEARLASPAALRLMNEFRRLQGSPSKNDHTTPLTAPELECLRLVAQGLSNSEISDRLGLSEKTVRNRLTIVFEKLHVHNRVQATLFALREGLASLSEMDD
ncbi:MAG: response regulator transcription factor [Anaerolineae bacterium]|nr:response regulator transcription factor [Anaerolineae bacterium]